MNAPLSKLLGLDAQLVAAEIVLRFRPLPDLQPGPNLRAANAPSPPDCWRLDAAMAAATKVYEELAQVKPFWA